MPIRESFYAGVQAACDRQIACQLLSDDIVFPQLNKTDVDIFRRAWRHGIDAWEIYYLSIGEATEQIACISKK
jgi:hypothetical protein